jgi:hypothetical protein
MIQSLLFELLGWERKPKKSVAISKGGDAGIAAREIFLEKWRAMHPYASNYRYKPRNHIRQDHLKADKNFELKTAYCNKCKCDLPISEFRLQEFNKLREKSPFCKCRVCEGLDAKERKEGKKRAYPCPDHCELCGDEFVKDRAFGYKAPVFDHFHESGKFRGWLCKSCNIGLGQLQDSKDILKKAITFLERSPIHDKQGFVIDFENRKNQKIIREELNFAVDYT